MISFCKGDMFNMHADALVNPVNCIGTAGKGLALEFKKRFPEAYNAYREHCFAGKMSMGELFIWHSGVLNKGPAIIHFPTKGHWREKSNLDDIEKGLFSLRRYMRMHLGKFKSVAIPALGCGLGGLDWRNVRAAMHTILIHEDSTHYYIFEPKD